MAASKNKITAETLVSTAELAVILGLTSRRINQFVQDGIMQSEGGKLNLCESVQQYLKFKESLPVDDESIKVEKAKKKAEATLKASKATIAKLEAEELQGKMHRSEDVAACTEQLIYTIKSYLTAIPGRTAIEVMAAKTEAEAAAIIRKEVNAAMRDIASFEYDPDKYAELVRQRRSWEASEGADDE